MATTDDNRIFIDTNILIYTMLVSSPFHANSFRMGGKQIHDANIVATMLAYGLRRLLTHNVVDFQRFSAWIEIIPLDLES